MGEEILSWCIIKTLPLSRHGGDDSITLSQRPVGRGLKLSPPVTLDNHAGWGLEVRRCGANSSQHHLNGVVSR